MAVLTRRVVAAAAGRQPGTPLLLGGEPAGARLIPACARAPLAMRREVRDGPPARELSGGSRADTLARAGLSNGARIFAAGAAWCGAELDAAGRCALSPSVPDTAASERALGSAVALAVAKVSARVHFASLHPPVAPGLLRALFQGGLAPTGGLVPIALAHLPGAPPPPWPAGVTVHAVEEEDDALEEAIVATFPGTADWPELQGRIPAAAMLSLHRANAATHPRWWWMVRDARGRPAGALLFTSRRRLADVDVTYVGLAPALRGRGLARSLLGAALARIDAPASAALRGVVDSRNAAARRLFRAAGFREGPASALWVRADLLVHRPLSRR